MVKLAAGEKEGGVSKDFVLLLHNSNSARRVYFEMDRGIRKTFAP